MKKVLFFASAAVLALSSCVKNEPVQTTESLEKIAFEVPVVAPNTKVMEILNNFIFSDNVTPAGNFKVFGHFTLEDWNASVEDPLADAYPYMPGVEMRLSDGVFVSDPASYWPKNGKLHFSAIYPATVDATVTKEGIQIAEYTVPTDKSQHIDLLISDRLCNQTKQVSGEVVQPVQVKFNHALSAINFIALTTGPEITIKEISISGVKPTASFNQMLSNDIDDNWNQDPEKYDQVYANWEPTEDPAVTYVAFSGTRVLDGTKRYVESGLDYYNFEPNLMLIPQDLSGGNHIVTVDYLMGETPQAASFVLSGTWSRGHRYNYTLSFAGDHITFTASTKNWNDSDSVTLN